MVQLFTYAWAPPQREHAFLVPDLKDCQKAIDHLQGRDSEDAAEALLLKTLAKKALAHDVLHRDSYFCSGHERPSPGAMLADKEHHDVEEATKSFEHRQEILDTHA